jgi:membrane protein
VTRSTDRTDPAAVSSDSPSEAPGGEKDRGRTAESPTDIPPRGWKDVAFRVKEESKVDQVVLLAAGVAFFGMLALVPALAALLTIYGLAADPAQISEQIVDALAATPAEVRDLIAQQVQDISEAPPGAVVAVVGGLLLALWSASTGMKSLIVAINRAYDEEETRGFVRLRGLSLMLTLGAILFFAIAFPVIAVLPSLIAASSLGTTGRVLVGIFRFVVLFGGLLAGLAVLYRYAPDRADPKWSWASPGAIAAGVVWVLGSLLFSFYTANFGTYNETYGALGAVVILMLWLLLTVLVVILGAELNCELERQTRRDTTTGPARGMGSRGAYAADTVGPSSDT